MSSFLRGPRVGLLAAYAVVFVGLDTGATLFETAPGVSPWYPSAGLHFALLLLLGPLFAPVVFAASLGSGLWISTPALPLGHLLLPNLVIASAHAGAAAWLRHRLADADLLSVRTALRFCLVALVLPAVVAVLAVASYRWTGLYGADAPLASILLGWWVGDAVGILTVTPLVLLLAHRWVVPDVLNEAEASLLHVQVRSPEAVARLAVQAAAVFGTLALVFYGPLGDRFPLYLCFLPLLWVGLQDGLPRTILAVGAVNLGAAGALARHDQPGGVLPFQLFMLAYALTGLVLGVLVTQRQRSVQLLQRAGRTLEDRIRQYTPHLLYPQAESSRAGSGQAGSGQAESGRAGSDRLGSEPSPSLHTDDEVPVSVPPQGSEGLHASTRHLVALNESLLESEASLARLNEQKDQFLSVISHDLKSPLFGIRGLTDVLLQQADDDRQQHLLSLIHQSSSQALTLLDNLLTWARLQAGSVPDDPVPNGLSSAVADCFALLDSHAQQKQIDLQNAIPAGLQVSMHDFTLDTVLRNLVSNAIKFTPDGGRVRVSAERRAEDVVVSVTDTGPGISADRCPSLFELGATGSTAGTANEPGTGLGLPVCRELLRRRGCTIWVESEEGVGSTFSFTLPAVSPSQASSQTSSPPDPSADSGEGTGSFPDSLSPSPA